MLKPNFQKIHENFPAAKKRLVKDIRLLLPLFSEFSGNFFHEDGVLIELILI
jgi:hypothetical protein